MKRILLVFLMLAMIPGALSARAEGAAFPEQPCSRVYEPETSWSMSATVVWEADISVFAAAEEEKRPATALVYPTPSLRIEDRNGRLISESIDEFVEKTSGTMIPAFYLRSR